MFDLRQTLPKYHRTFCHEDAVLEIVLTDQSDYSICYFTVRIFIHTVHKCGHVGALCVFFPCWFTSCFSSNVQNSANPGNFHAQISRLYLPAIATNNAITHTRCMRAAADSCLSPAACAPRPFPSRLFISHSCQWTKIQQFLGLYFTQPCRTRQISYCLVIGHICHLFCHTHPLCALHIRPLPLPCRARALVVPQPLIYQSNLSTDKILAISGHFLHRDPADINFFSSATSITHTGCARTTPHLPQLTPLQSLPYVIGPTTVTWWRGIRRATASGKDRSGGTIPHLGSSRAKVIPILLTPTT